MLYVQYLDLRFNSRLVRCIASFTYVVRSLLNLGVTVFTPCVALKTVIGLPYWASILSITTISVVFTIMVIFSNIQQTEYKIFLGPIKKKKLGGPPYVYSCTCSVHTAMEEFTLKNIFDTKSEINQPLRIHVQGRHTDCNSFKASQM